MNQSSPIRHISTLQSTGVATAEDIEAAIEFVKNATMNNLHIEVSEEKLKKIAKKYL